MKKYFAFAVGLVGFLPVNCWALGSADLAVELGEDVEVFVGEKFHIGVKSAYDKTETCAKFFYDWRQSKGPITATPLNNDVLNPEFQINTVGEYVFSLAIETRCEGVENTRSESDKIKITVKERENLEEKNYTHEILPNKINLTADGADSWDLNFYVGNDDEKPSDEKIEFTLSSEDELLKDNLGKLDTLNKVTKNGMMALTYTAPQITEKNWSGSVQILAKSAYGEATAQIQLVSDEKDYGAELKVAQNVFGLPYLAKNQRTLGLINLEILEEDETEIGVVNVKLNGENIYHEEKIFFREWTEAQRENLEDEVSFYFVPKEEENKLEAQIEIGGKIIILEKNFKAYDVENLELEIVALAEGKWANEVALNLEENLREMVKFLEERAMTEVTTKNSLGAVPVIAKDKISEEMIVVLPEGYDGDILTEKNIHADGDKCELAEVYFRSLARENENQISDEGVWIKSETENINDKGYVKINAEVASLLSKNKGAGIPYDTAWASLAKLRSVGSYADLQRSHWSYPYLREMIGRGIISGYDDATVRPDQQITRAEFVKILLSSGKVQTDIVQNNVNFLDMSGVDWSMPYVEKAVRRGLVSGYADGTFRPNKSISRAEAVKILAEYLNLEMPENAESTFSDVESEAWYAPYVEAIRSAEIITGYADGTFRPENAITRAEASKIIQLAVFGK